MSECEIWENGDVCPDFLFEAYPRARKQHKCCECKAPILPGEVYERATGMWECDIKTFKTCLSCAELRKELSSSQRGPCYESLGCYYAEDLQAQAAALQARANAKR